MPAARARASAAALAPTTIGTPGQLGVQVDHRRGSWSTWAAAVVRRPGGSWHATARTSTLLEVDGSRGGLVRVVR